MGKIILTMMICLMLAGCATDEFKSSNPKLAEHQLMKRD